MRCRCHAALFRISPAAAESWALLEIVRAENQAAKAENTLLRAKVDRLLGPENAALKAQDEHRTHGQNAARLEQELAHAGAKLNDLECELGRLHDGLNWPLLAAAGVAYDSGGLGGGWTGESPPLLVPKRDR